MRISPRRSLKKALTELASPRRCAGATRSSFGSSGSFSIGELKKDDVFISTDSCTRSRHTSTLVKFDEKSNQYYEPQHDVVDQWYTNEEAATFRKECSKLARLLSAAEETSSDAEKWSQGLLDAYQGFCQAETADEVMNVFESNKVHLPNGALGLDSWVVRPIHYDRVERRRRLVSQINSLQHSVSDENSRSSKMLKASRALSRPSRLYAHHVGLLVAGAVEEENA